MLIKRLIKIIKRFKHLSNIQSDAQYIIFQANSSNIEPILGHESFRGTAAAFIYSNSFFELFWTTWFYLCKLYYMTNIQHKIINKNWNVFAHKLKQ